jgi:GNAT superfamily N-acetyltransferase
MFLGKGIGQRLMAACFENARNGGYDVCGSAYGNSIHGLSVFMRRTVFALWEEHTFQLGSDPQTDLLMQKEL